MEFLATTIACNGAERETSYAYAIRACAGANCGGWTEPQVVVRAVATLSRAAGATTYYHTDALGSPVAETDAAGAVVKRRAYRPWGAPVTGSYEQGPGYTGHVTDALTGLSYMQQRYYDPVAGRFLSTDPVPASPGSFNRYWYANNNPYRNVDPDGRLCMPALSDSEMCDRSLRYESMDDDPKLRGFTRFFGAASMVTNVLGTIRGFGPNAKFMSRLSRRLERSNLQRAELIKSGKLASLGSVASNDAAFVHYEQSIVQSQLDEMKTDSPIGYKTLVLYSNSALNGPLADPNFRRARDAAVREIGGPIDFANQSHRETLGRAVAEVARQVGRPCTGTHIGRAC